MAKRRELKGAINYICDMLMAECMVMSLRSEDLNKVEEVIALICKTRKDFASRVSHQEPGMVAKRYFGDVIEAFNLRTGEILGQMEKL